AGHVQKCEDLLDKLAEKKQTQSTPLGPDGKPKLVWKPWFSQMSDNQKAHSALYNFSVDMTEQASKKKLDPVIGRETEIEQVIKTLGRRQKNNPILLGEAGVGKTAIVEGLSQKIVAGDVPKILQGRSIVSLDLGAMVAGTKYRGEFEARIK